MKEEHIGKVESKEIFYDELEEFAREKIRGHLQELLEEEVTEWLGREKSERKMKSSEQAGYRNGYGKRRRFTLSVGTVEIRRPRVRNLDERFVSRVLPLFKRQTRQVRDLIPELYLHGLASGDFELALRGLLGEGAPLSASSLGRLKEKWEGEYERWKSEPVEEAQWAYLWADGIYVKAGIGKEKAALLVVIGVMRDGSKRFLALEVGHRESKGAAVGEIFPEAAEQLCWNHKMLNVMDRVSKKEQVQAKRHLTAMMYAESRREALKERKKFEQTFRHNPRAVRTVVENWDRLTSYYDFPREATCLIWKTMMVAEMNFRKLNAPHLVEKVAEGKKYENGEEVRVAA